MADNVRGGSNDGTLPLIATDDRTIGGTAVQVPRADEIGSSTLATGQVTVTTTAATYLAAQDTRKRVVIVNNSTQTVWLGPATVTTANGFPLPVGAAVELRTTALIQAIIASGTMSGTVDYWQEYD